MTSGPPVVQYVFLRKDLKKFKYKLGAIIAQACHACIAANERYKTQVETVEYVTNYPRMIKVILQVDNEKAMMEAEVYLQQNNLDYHKWVEQPESLATCIALRPYRKAQVEHLMTRFQLYK